MKKILLIIALVCSLSFAESTFYPYALSTKYSSNSSKDKGSEYGVIGSYNMDSYFLEYGIGNTKISYQDKSLEDFEKLDFTIVYNQYMGYDFLARAGFHYISSSDNKLDSGKILIFSAKKFNGESSEMGIDFYYSSYGKTIPFTIMQFSPYVGFGFDLPYTPGSMYLKGTYNIIKPQDHPSGSNQKFLNLSIANIYKSLTTTLSTNLIGNEQLSVSDLGFSSYNTEDEYTKNVSLSFKYKLNKKYSFELKGRRVEFSDDKTSKKSTADSYSFNVSLSF